MKRPLTSRKQPTQARAKATVAAILEAAAQLLVRDGYDRSNTNRIAQIAGVSIGTLYQYFPNKESLFCALIKEHMNEIHDLLQLNVTELVSDPIADSVRTFIEAMHRVHLVRPKLHLEITLLQPRLALDAMLETHRRSQILVEQWLKMRADEIKVRDFKTAAFLLVTCVESSTHAAIVENPQSFADGSLADEMVAMILGYLL